MSGKRPTHTADRKRGTRDCSIEVNGRRYELELTCGAYPEQ